MSFEAILEQHKHKPGKRRYLMLGISLVFHVGLLTAGLVRGMWHVDELSSPAVHVSLNASLTPPPPPPPPPAAKKATKPKTKPVAIVQPTPNEIAQPKEQPKEAAPPPEEQEEEVEGGAEGGVPGGVVGGVVGAAGPAKMVSAQVARAQLLINPDDDQYKVRLPPSLSRAGVQFWAGVKVCVAPDGTVSDVKVLKKADPSIDEQIPTVLRRWRYSPYMIDNRPVSFCYMLRYEITAR